METLKNTDFSWHEDQPDVPQKTASQMKEFLDAPTHTLMRKINEVIEDLYGAAGDDGKLSGKQNILRQGTGVIITDCSMHFGPDYARIDVDADGTPTSGSSKPVTSGGVYTALAGKQDTLTFDSTPTSGSNNPVKSGGIYTALAGKQNTLTAGNGISIVNNVISALSSGGGVTAVADQDGLLAAATGVYYYDGTSGAPFDLGDPEDPALSLTGNVLFLKIKDVDGAHTVWILSGTDVYFASAAYDDAYLTVTDMMDYVKPTDFATSQNAGIIKPTSSSNGISSVGGTLQVSPANAESIRIGNGGRMPIVPNTVSAAAFWGLALAAGVNTSTDTSTLGNYSEAAKTAIKNMLGIS